MGRISSAVRAKALTSLRVGWLATVLGAIFLIMMIISKMLSSVSSSKSFFLHSFITPNQGIAIILALGALLMSYELFTTRTSRTRSRAVFRVLTEEDIHILYTSPLSTWEIMLINLLSNIIIFLLVPAPLGIGLIVGIVPVYGVRAIYLLIYTSLILTLAFIHGLCLYMLLQSPRGLQTYNNVRLLYFTILGLTFLGPAIANTSIFFISPSATFANAIIELLEGAPGPALILSILYTVAPLYLLYIFSRQDYVIKPLDMISAVPIKEIYKVRVSNLRDFIRLIYTKTPTLILSYVLLPVAFIPLISFYVHFLPSPIVESALPSMMMYVILIVMFSPAELVYYSGVIVGLSGWLIWQSTLPSREIFNKVIREALARSSPQMIILISALGVESILYGIRSGFFNDFLTSIIIFILLFPILRIESQISAMRGLKLYMKSGNLPLAVDMKIARTAEEEMKDKMIFALHILPLFGSAITLSYGITFIISNLYSTGMGMIIASIIMYVISIVLAKIAEKILRI
ncbi:MAG: hypothetical protein GXO10_02050 [Crenarchaeota archaeon]|nr:hypothetical protein [Thermoproteota archaeon]